MKRPAQIALVVGGSVAATAAIAGLTYGIASAFGSSSWPSEGDGCPIQTYRNVLAQHNVPQKTADAAWRYMPLVAYAASHFNIDPTLLAGLVHTESGWNPDAGSSAGAVGLTQFIPSTAASIYQQLAETGNWPFSRVNSQDPQANGYFAKHNLGDVIDRTDPKQALWLAAYFLSIMLRNHNVDWALAAYNGGPSNANKPYDQRPAETQAYVPGVLKRQKWYQEVASAC